MNKYSKFVAQFIKTSKPDKKTLLTAKRLLDLTSGIYYNTDEDSPLTDEEWDKLLHHFHKFGKYTAGAKPKEGKRLVDVGHIFPELVGTLDKTNFVYKKEKLDEKGKEKDVDTVEEWFNRKKIPSNRKIKVAISEKKDGNSVTATYDGNTKKPKLFLTRGKDGQGADLTSLFKNRKLTIDTDYKGTIGVKYEAIVNDEKFEELTSLIGKSFANARSLTAGILGSSDGAKYSDHISLVPIRIQFGNDHITRDNRRLTREQEIELIQNSPNASEIGINIQVVSGTVKDVIKQIKAVYDDYINNIRATLDHPIDGLVIEILDEDLRESLGRDDDRNNYDFALKFPYMVKRSTVTGMRFDYGKTGRITPVVQFKPVTFNGAECTNVSIANFKRFRELKLGVGDSILVEYRNDVLAYVTRDPKSKPIGDPIKFIGRCPKCKSKLKVSPNKTFVFCDNDQCEGLIKGKIENWFTKLNIKGVKASTISKLVDSGAVTSIPDLYKLTYSKLEEAGFGVKSGANIYNAIHGKKTINDWELLGSLSFKDVGRTTAKLVLKELQLEELIQLANESYNKFIKRLIEIQGIQTITAENIYNGIQDNEEIIKQLKKVLTIKSLKQQGLKNKMQGVESKSIVFTGFRDADLQELLEGKGHSIKGSVSKNTDMLVIKDKSKGGSKLKKAEDLGITVYTLDEFKSSVVNTL
jgi:DNA ligase (NAD+)